MVLHPEAVPQKIRLHLGAHLHVFIGESGFKGGYHTASLFGEIPYPLKAVFLCRIKGWHKKDIVARKLFLLRAHKITFNIHFIQRIINPSYHIIIICPVCAVSGEREPFQGGQSFIAHHNCHFIFLFQMQQAGAQLTELPSNPAGLTVYRIFLKIMAEQPLPIGFAGIVDGMPVPVHHRIRSAGKVAEGLQTKLPFIRRPLREALRLRFNQEIIVLFQGSGQIAAKGNLLSGQLVLAGMIDVTACNGHRLCRLKMIHIRLHPIGIALPGKVKIMGDKLVRPFILPDNLCLAFQEISNQLSLELLKLTAQAAVDGPRHTGEFLPGINPVAPVIQAEIMVKTLQIPLVFFPHIPHKHLLHILTTRTEMLCLIIQLKTDDTPVTRHSLHQPADNPFRKKTVGRVRDIHNLPGAIRPPAAPVRNHDLRIGLGHPCRNRIGRGAHDHIKPLPFAGIQNLCHMGKIKHSLLRLLRTPG